MCTSLARLIVGHGSPALCRVRGHRMEQRASLCPPPWDGSRDVQASSAQGRWRPRLELHAHGGGDCTGRTTAPGRSPRRPGTTARPSRPSSTSSPRRPMRTATASCRPKSASPPSIRTARCGSSTRSTARPSSPSIASRHSRLTIQTGRRPSRSRRSSPATSRRWRSSARRTGRRSSARPTPA